MHPGSKSKIFTHLNRHIKHILRDREKYSQSIKEGYEQISRVEGLQKVEFQGDIEHLLDILRKVVKGEEDIDEKRYYGL